MRKRLSLNIGLPRRPPPQKKSAWRGEPKPNKWLCMRRELGGDDQHVGLAARGKKGMATQVVFEFMQSCLNAPLCPPFLKMGKPVRGWDETKSNGHGRASDALIRADRNLSGYWR